MTKKYFIHNPIFRILAPAVYGVLIYLLLLLINNNVTQINVLFSTQEVYVCIGLSYISFESTRLTIILLGKYLKHKPEKFQVGIQFFLTVLFSVTLVTASISLYFKYVIGFSISGTQLSLFISIFVITVVLYNLLYFSNYYLHKENTLKLNAEKQQRDVLEMEMLEFKNDINPDLLYESLENLIGIMYRDVEQAEDYIDSLASAYRYVLSNRQQELVPVTTELDAAKNLVKLLNEKYNGQLRLESSLEKDELSAVVIPGSLLVVIENMVRNTIITRHDPLIIKCYMEDEYITLQCKLNERLLLHPNSELALARLQKSYSLYSELPLIKVKGYHENYVKLPVILVANEIGIQ